MENPMNAAVSVESIAGFTALNYRTISTFQDLKINIQSFDDYDQIKAWLFAIGYAWSDDDKTQRELYFSALPECVYAAHDGNLYFDALDSVGVTEYKCVGGLYVKSLLEIKASQMKIKR